MANLSNQALNNLNAQSQTSAINNQNWQTTTAGISGTMQQAGPYYATTTGSYVYTNTTETRLQIIELKLSKIELLLEELVQDKRLLQNLRK